MYLRGLFRYLQWAQDMLKRRCCELDVISLLIRNYVPGLNIRFCAIILCIKMLFQQNRVFHFEQVYLGIDRVLNPLAFDCFFIFIKSVADL